MAELAEEVTNRVEREVIELKRKKIKSFEILEIVSKILVGKKGPDTLLRFLTYRMGEDPIRLKGFLRKYFK